MKPAPFEYVCPTSMAEAVALLAEHAGEAKPLAGGQSLVPLMNLRLARPGVVVDLNRLGELDHLEVSDGDLVIGALVRHERLVADPVVREAAPLLRQAGAWIGHGAIRHRGTIGGSLAHADPAAELPAVAVALGAEFTVTGPKGDRTVPAGAFFTGPLSTVLADDELLIDVRVPLEAGARRFGFAELARRHGDFALVLAAAVVDDDGTARVALGGVGPTPVLVDGLEAAVAACHPADDVHAPASYRRALVETLVARALEQAGAVP